MNNVYRTPRLLDQIMNWGREFHREVEYVDNPTGLALGIDFSEKEGYFCTPVDSFPFARTGVDGIHFALLTDFGLHADLDEAPVIIVSPMDLERVRLVARNVRDFFRLHVFDELIVLNHFPSKESYQEHVRMEENRDLNSEWFDHDRWKREKLRVSSAMQEKFGLFPISDPYEYLQAIRLERSARVSTVTEDSLGIIAPPSGMTQRKAELLASIRNLQHTASSNKDSVQRHAAELLHMGMIHEAERLLARLLR